ncbi:PH domain-containing protein [Rufibacter radiotolerans]|nr:PH domain-containing protein [Rufibacter radiotolerans]
MEYKASLDSFAKVITAGTVLLFLALGYKSVKALAAAPNDMTTLLIHGGLLLFMAAILLGCYLYAPQSYRVGANYLEIVRPAQNKRINFTDIREIRALAGPEMNGVIRTFGVGGLFGYFGKYYSPGLGSMTFYATQRNNRLIIETRQGKKMILTPDNPQLLEHLEAQLATKR